MELGISRALVTRFVERGLLKETRTVGDSHWRFIDADSVFALKRVRALNPPRRGRPRKQTEEES